MPASNHHPRPATEVRRFGAEETGQVERYFREAGYPVPLDQVAAAWGAREGGALVGCLALCIEEGVEILRGPEVVFQRRRRGIGRLLIRAAGSELDARSCYCVAYAHLNRLYREVGFRRCEPDEGPEFLRRRVADLQSRGWNVGLLVKRAQRD